VEQLQTIPPSSGHKVYVLFLPSNEVHELGLLYSYYELLLHGRRCIYLGQSVPLDSLHDLKLHFQELVYITAFTIHPPDEKLKEYLEAISGSLLRKGKDQLWVSGRKIQSVTGRPKIQGIHYILSPEDFLRRL
jgi:hypothetical protein